MKTLDEFIAKVGKSQGECPRCGSPIVGEWYKMYTHGYKINICENCGNLIRRDL